MSNTQKRVISGANGFLLVFVVTGIAIVLNVIMSDTSFTWDLTENKIYTLSDASIESVRGLEEPIVIKAFISPDMPAPYHTLGQNLTDLLTDYETKSNGKLTFQLIQPGPDDKEAEEAALGYGIQKRAIGKQSEDERIVRLIYHGVAFIQGDKHETIPFLQSSGSPELDNFEYEITKSIMALRSSEPLVVGFVGGLGGPASSPQFLQQIQPIFSQLYGNLIELKTVDLSAENSIIGEEVDALIILNATVQVSEAAMFSIDQFIQRGGSVGWFQSAAGPDMELRQQLAKQMPPNQIPDIRKTLNTGLNEFFATYGLAMQKDIVLDRKHAMTGVVMTQQGLAQVSHPATFLMQEIDKSLPFTRGVQSIAIPAPASIVIDPELAKTPEIEVYEVIKTEDSAVRWKAPPTQMNYQELITPKPDEESGRFVVAAAMSGTFKSYYSNAKLPAGKTEADLVKSDPAKPSRILIVGSGEFFAPRNDVGFNQSLAQIGGQFFIGSIEWLVQDSKLSQIRAKNMPRLLGKVPKQSQRQIQFINIVAVPAAFILIGNLMRIYRRRRRKQLAV